ncbi:unnamed protein product [Musa acuminata subsp. burmannicoides]
MSQKVYLERGMLYTFSAWLQVDQGNTTITAIFETAKDGLVPIGAVEARSGCWSMLKGGLTAKSSGPAEFHFESKDTSVEIWVDSVSLQPFTEGQWRAHQAESINKVRKKTVAIRAVDANGNALPGASVSIQQKRSGFPLVAPSPAPSSRTRHTRAGSPPLHRHHFRERDEVALERAGAGQGAVRRRGRHARVREAARHRRQRPQLGHGRP